jgi:hypothetical protein
VTRSDTQNDAIRLARGNPKNTVRDMGLIALVLGTALWLTVTYISIRLFTRRVISRTLEAVVSGGGLFVCLLVASWPEQVAGPSWLFLTPLLIASLVGAVVAYLIAPMFQAG